MSFVTFLQQSGAKLTGKEVNVMHRILIVEDDALLNSTLAYNLRAEGYDVEQAFSVREAKEAAAAEVVLLDVNLPDGSGLSLGDHFTQSYVVFLTANDSEEDMLAGYAAGGADYVTKPFSVAVLCKKIAAVFARMAQQEPLHEIYDDGVLHIDFSAQTAMLAGAAFTLTPQEYRALALFTAHPHIILTKRQLLTQLWDVDELFVDEHTLATIISRIRKKIERGERKYIKTVYGIGYQWLGDANL